MPNPVKSLEYIKCHSLSSPRPVKSPSNSIKYNCEKICSSSRRLKTILKIKKSSHLIDHGTLESGISCKWCDKFSRLIEWFVYADGNGRNNFWFDCQSTLYIWHLIAEGPLQFHLATFFSKNSLWTETTKNDQKWPKNNVFSLFWKILQLIFAGNDLK